jgi:hypothetical protein
MLYVTVSAVGGDINFDDDGNVIVEQVPTWVTGENNVRSMFLGELLLVGSLNDFRSATNFIFLFYNFLGGVIIPKFTIEPVRASTIMKAFANPQDKNLMSVLSGQRILNDFGLAEQGNQILNPINLRVPGPQGNIIRGHEGFYPRVLFTLGDEGDVLLLQAM